MAEADFPQTTFPLGAVTDEKPARRQLNRLNAKQLYALCERMKQDYVSSRMDDGQYAMMLTTEPSWPFPVSRFSIATAREMMNMKANVLAIAEERKAEREAAKAAKATPGCDHTLILDELHTLQRMVAGLSKQIHTMQEQMNA
jgi:hypothetical protein